MTAVRQMLAGALPVLVAYGLLLAACAAEDPDPCDPGCPKTDCGEVGCDGA